MHKKFLSVLLILIMSVNLIPSTVFSATGNSLAHESGAKVYAEYTFWGDSLSHLNDGNPQASSRWTGYEMPHSSVYIGCKFNEEKNVSSVELNVYNDNGGVRPPEKITVKYLENDMYKTVTNVKSTPSVPAEGANVITFNTVKTNDIRIYLDRQSALSWPTGVGVTEMYIYEGAQAPTVTEAPVVIVKPVATAVPSESSTMENIASKGIFTPSYTYYNDRVSHLNDGIISYNDNPRNRWTSYENPSDSVNVDFTLGKACSIGEIDLYVFSDGGGVREPQEINIQYLNNGKWTNVNNIAKNPMKPTAKLNKIVFDTISTTSIRISMKGTKAVGLTEVCIYGESRDAEIKDEVQPVITPMPNPDVPVAVSGIEAIYNEVKTPYRYDVALKWSGNNGDFDSQMVDNPNVFKIPGDNEYVYMTYVGFDGTGYQTGLARSRDFLTWEKLGVVLDNSTASDWDRYNAAGYIVRDHEWGKAPTPHITADGRLAMTYLASGTAGYEAGVKKAGVAFTDSLFDRNGNLSKWQRHPNPVLDASDGKYSYEKHTIWKLQAIWDKDNQRYVGFYNAAGGPEIMCQAYSPDLVNWTREESNPVITASKDANGGSWGNTHNADADVVKIGDTWVMFYFTNAPDGNIIDSFAVSNDMIKWEKSFKKLTYCQTYSGSYAHKPCVLKHNGVVYHYYCGVGDQGRIIAVDTSVDLTVLKQAKAITRGQCTDLQYRDLQIAIANVQRALIKDDGSIEDINYKLSDLQKILNTL